MHKFVFHNDRIFPLSEIRLSPGQAGLFNGWGVFTTMRIYNEHPFVFERHWERLRIDADLINLPLNFSAELVLRRLRELICANKVKDGCARIYFIHNKIGFWCSKEPFPPTDFLMYTTDLPVREGTTQLAVQEHGRYAANPLSGTKVTSWLQNVWSLEQAHQRGFDEMVLLNERGEVAECTAANLFCVRGGVVETPPLSAGCLAGVTRQLLLEIGCKLGVPIQERSLTLQELHGAEEIFITSTTREVQAVSQVEDHRLAGVPGPITTPLAEAFSRYVLQYVANRELRLKA